MVGGIRGTGAFERGRSTAGRPAAGPGFAAPLAVAAAAPRPIIVALGGATGNLDTADGVGRKGACGRAEGLVGRGPVPAGRGGSFADAAGSLDVTPLAAPGATDFGATEGGDWRGGCSSPPGPSPPPSS